jgi:hypothetical protein
MHVNLPTLPLHHDGQQFDEFVSTINRSEAIEDEHVDMEHHPAAPPVGYEPRAIGRSHSGRAIHAHPRSGRMNSAILYRLAVVHIQARIHRSHSAPHLPLPSFTSGRAPTAHTVHALPLSS